MSMDSIYAGLDREELLATLKLRDEQFLELERKEKSWGDLLGFQTAILRETTAHRHRMDEELVPLREVARVADLVWRGASLCETDEERYYRISPMDMEWLATALAKPKTAPSADEVNK